MVSFVLFSKNITFNEEFKMCSSLARSFGSNNPKNFLIPTTNERHFAFCLLKLIYKRLLIKGMKYKLHIIFTKQKRFRPMLSNVQQNNLLINSAMFVSMHSTSPPPFL